MHDVETKVGLNQSLSCGLIGRGRSYDLFHHLPLFFQWPSLLLMPLLTLFLFVLVHPPTFSFSFSFEAQQQTWPDKPLAPSSHANPILPRDGLLDRISLQWRIHSLECNQLECPIQALFWPFTSVGLAATCFFHFYVLSISVLRWIGCSENAGGEEMGYNLGTGLGRTCYHLR